jgi:alpha-L-rhamnosidase
MRNPAYAAWFRISAIVLGATSMAMSAEMIPQDLRSEGLGGVAAVTSVPHFSWRVESGGRGQAQSAWQILVSGSKDLLAQDIAELWDSGKTAISRTPLVSYAGSPLLAGSRYYWKVRCWESNDQPSAWSETAIMEVAPTKPADWNGARWIDDGRDNPEKPEEFYQPDPAPLLRHEFKLTKPVLRARLHVAGLGYAYASLNGERLDKQVLDPPWTNFDKRILFRTHDVTEALTEGMHCIGLALGNGWYNPLPLRMWGHRNIRESLPIGRPRAIALLVVEHPDGTRTTVTTGPDWKVAPGPTLRNSIFLGEERDARLDTYSRVDKPGWDTPGFDASSWKSVRVAEASLEPLVPILDMPPVASTEIITPVAVTSPTTDTHIVDFGQNFTGVPMIVLNVSSGTRITLRYGEILHPDGTLNPMTSVCGQIKGMRKNNKGEESLIGGPGSPPIAWQQDVYTARGGGEIYSPNFTFHAFRYMEITGLLEVPKLEAIRGIRMHSDLPDAGSFSCSNELFNRIQKITRNTFTNNAISVQSDCPHRERFGYGGDIAVTSEAYLMNYNMAGFYAKTVRDFADAARPDGNFTDTVPFVGVQYCGIGWAMTHPLLMEQLYQHYGNLSLIEEQLPAAVRWFELEASKRENGLVVKGLGDHEALERIGGPVVTTPMFIDTARRMARLSRIVGKEKDAVRFDQMAEESSSAWAEKFLDPKTGKVGGGSQSEQVLALGFGAVPESARLAVFLNLANQLNVRNDGTSLTTGIYGTRLLLEELTKHGRHDLAYALADRKTFPSWGWMLENGATSLWETWKESDNTFSHNHPMFGSISAWFFRHLGGIQAADDAIGFDRILIRPQTGYGLTWVKSSHRSVRGLIESNWKITESVGEFDIVVPPDTTALIQLPAGTITESGKPLSESEGVVVLPQEDHFQHLKVGSGRYRFVLGK